MKKKFTIRVENSAPSQSKPAKSVNWACQILQTDGVHSVADYGCGRLRNMIPLIQSFKNVTFVDTEFQLERIKNNFNSSNGAQLVSNNEFCKMKGSLDAIFLISILHIIPQKKTRKEIISLAVSKIRKGGYLIIDVPTGVGYYEENCTADRKYYDGYAMGNGAYRTFYKKFYAKELDKLINFNGDLELYKKIYFDKHLVRIMKKI